MVAFFLCVLCSLFISCEQPAVSENSIKIVSWNVENLMDTNVDGSEYADFSLTNYDEHVYRRRLKVICDVIDDLDGDIVVLQEVENSNVLNDMVNLYLSRKGYLYFGAVKNEDSAIAIGFVSKIKPTNISVHSVKDARSVLALDFLIDDELLRVLTFHGKSQIEGFEETEEKRINLSKTLKRIINNNLDCNIVCMGDYNEDPSVYNPIQTALYDVEKENAFYFRDKGSLLISSSSYSLIQDILYSPQIDMSFRKSKKGTYNYKNSWYNLDLALLNNNLFDYLGIEFDDFNIYAPQKICTSTGIPYSWNPKSLTGVSDHFPIYVTLKRLKK